MARALDKADKPNDKLLQDIYNARQELLEIEKELVGDKTKAEIGERSNPTPNDGGMIGLFALNTNTYGPTPNQIAAFNRAQKQLSEINVKLKELTGAKLPAIEKELKAAGAPWMEGQKLIEN